MKRRDLIRELERSGCEFVRHGGRHDLYRNPGNGRQAPIPRHREVGETLCQAIRNQLGVIEEVSAGPDIDLATD